MSEKEKKETVEKHILTEQDFRKLILDKLERAKLQSQLLNRSLKEVA
jgi:hypothetical protein